MLTRAFAEGRQIERSGLGAAGANLTKLQKKATVRKWADWILKQREAAKSGLAADSRGRGASA